VATDLKTILNQIKNKDTKAIYALDGEEPYFIDTICDAFENNVLAPAEKDFNLTIMYGKDSNWVDVVNACKRFPMFAEKQVVILKEAQTLKDFGSLEAYFEKPMASTIFVIAHKYKKFDARLKATKVLLKNAESFTSNVIKENAMPDWIMDCAKSKAIKIDGSVAALLYNYLGNDLQKISNELDKVQLNLAADKMLTKEIVAKFIGNSKEYGVFEMPDAIVKKQKDKVYAMLKYFLANPKEAPMVLMLGSLYNKFSQIYGWHSLRGMPDKDVAAALKMSPFFVRDLAGQAQYFNLQKSSLALDIIYEYNLKTVGINNTASEGGLLKELVSKLLAI
jgi:DNA polymerase III subunit delta